MYTWKRYFVVQADYQHWANEVLFAALAHLKPDSLTDDQGLPNGNIHHAVDRMLTVGDIWLARLQGADIRDNFCGLRHPVWRELLGAMRHASRHLEEWLESRPDAFFEGEIHFTDRDGKLHAMWVRDALNQLFTHNAHCRGEIAAIATRLGAPRPEMDYAQYRREMEKLLEAARQAPH